MTGDDCGKSSKLVGIAVVEVVDNVENVDLVLVAVVETGVLPFTQPQVVWSTTNPLGHVTFAQMQLQVLVSTWKLSGQ
jgi:hypothetical protein